MLWEQWCLLWMFIGISYLLVTYRINWVMWRKSHPGVMDAMFRVGLHALLGPLIWIAAGITLLYRKITRA